MQYLMGKRNCTKGMARAIAVLLILIAILVAAIAIATVVRIHSEADAANCSIAIDKAERMLENSSAGATALELDEAEGIIDTSKWAREALCPAGGDYYVVEGGGAGQPYAIVCGLHGSDAKQRCRLNAQAARKHVEEALAEAAEKGEAAPASVTFTLNGKQLTAEQGDTVMDRGTSITQGYKGIVAFYRVNGTEMTSFSYADEDEAANWTERSGWR